MMTLAKLLQASFFVIGAAFGNWRPLPGVQPTDATSALGISELMRLENSSALKAAFNRDRGKVRIVMLVSPT
jgi:hypothetical protein